MNHAVNVGVHGEDLVKGGLIGDVHLVKLGTLAGDELHTVDAFLRSVVQVVNNDDLVASVKQSKAGKGANVANATRIKKRSVHVY